MRTSIPLKSASLQTRPILASMRPSAFLLTLLAATFGGTCFATAQTPSAPASSATSHKTTQSKASHKASKKEPPPPAPLPPPPPDWPVNDKPNQASIVWDSKGLRIDAENSSLQQILHDVAVATGSRVEGLGADQRVYGAYGPGQARDVLMLLLNGSGYNVLMAGDLGQGAPRQIMLSMRRTGGNAPGTIQSIQENNEDEIPDNEVEEQPQPPPPQPPQGPNQPGFVPAGPIRTPQQVMEEMQQRQLQQQQLQQQPPENPPTNPQD